MCINAETSWEDFSIFEWSFGCLRLGANGVAVLSPEEGGGLPPTLVDTEEQTDEDYDDSARDIAIKNHDIDLTHNYMFHNNLYIPKNNLIQQLGNNTSILVTHLKNGNLLFHLNNDFKFEKYSLV